MTQGLQRWRAGDGRRGSQIVEASFIFLLFLGIFWLLFDTAWAVFVKATLQHAVREGCRYAITSQTDVAQGLGHVDSIKSVVLDHSLNLLAGQQEKIHVRFFQADSLEQVQSNMGGLLVVVSVEEFAINPMVAVLKSGDPILLSVRAGDRMEASPSGIPPPM